MIANGIASSDHRRRRQHDVEAALDPGVEALQRHVVDVDDRQPVEILEAGAQRDELQEVGHDLDVDELAAGDLHQVEQLGVLLERQRDVEVIDALALGDLGDLGQRAEQRQPAVADVIAAGAIVDEADDLIAELAVLEDAVGDHAAEIAGAGDQDALQADAGAPAALEQLAHRFARGVGEHHVEREEQPPDDLRDLVGALRPCRVGGVVGADVQRREDAEDHRQDAADQHGEEVVHARAAAAQPVDALQLEGERRQHGDERQHVQVLLERRVAACRPESARSRSGCRRRARTPTSPAARR